MARRRGAENEVAITRIGWPDDLADGKGDAAIEDALVVSTRAGGAGPIDDLATQCPSVS